MPEKTSSKRIRMPVSTYRIIRAILGVLFGGYLLWRLYKVFIGSPIYGPETWIRFALAGVILGSVYALIAIGYTLVYGILFMINFAHGDIMMLGAFGGYFIFEAFKSIPSPTPANPELTFLLFLPS
jgi:branched-chain amino acid transport system permease protein